MRRGAALLAERMAHAALVRGWAASSIDRRPQIGKCDRARSGIGAVTGRGHEALAPSQELRGPSGRRRYLAPSARQEASRPAGRDQTHNADHDESLRQVARPRLL